MSDRDVVVACPCEGTPHTTDTITLFDKLPGAAGMACYASISLSPGLSVAGITGTWGFELAKMGVESWTLTTRNDKDKDEPLVISPQAVEELPFGIQAAIANAASGRWIKELMSPLPIASGSASPPGQTETSTSPNPRSGQPRRSSSKRSSPNGSAGRPYPAAHPVL